LFIRFFNTSEARGMALAQMTQDEWNIIDLYSYYVFRKIGEPVLSTQQDGPVEDLSPDKMRYIDAATGEYKEMIIPETNF
jgi:hypothetical protein